MIVCACCNTPIAFEPHVITCENCTLTCLEPGVHCPARDCTEFMASQRGDETLLWAAVV